MAPPHSAKTEREKKLKSLLTFASSLTDRFSVSRDSSLQEDLQSHINGLPLPASSTVAAKQDELDRLGTELWNLSTRLRRDDAPPKERSKDDTVGWKRKFCLLRVFAFLLLDTAGGQATKARERKHCIRLTKVALKTARVCIDSNDLGSATKVLERVADYHDALGSEGGREGDDEARCGECLRVEYFVLRTTLAWRQDRMDTAEHMFMKSRQLSWAMDSTTAESLADLLYEMGKDLLGKRNYELAIRWLERGYDVLGEQDLETLGPEAGELRLSIMQTMVQAYMKLRTAEAQCKAWDTLKLLETDYGEKMAVQLLKLELLSVGDSVDSSQIYAVLLRMIRTVVLNETNFRTIMHHVHKLKDHSNVTACKALDDLLEIRLLREENPSWVEKTVITRIWAGTTGPSPDNPLESLQELLETVSRNTKYPLSAPATHAAQTLLWKRVEAAYSQDQFALAESWCRLCLHPLFDKAGELNKSKIARKVILCALSRQDYTAAREVFARMSDTGRNEPITRYLLYKVALHSGDADLATECLDLVCRKSVKDATLLYACVLEAQSTGNKQHTITALERILERCEHSAPAGVHLPALLRCTARTLISGLVQDGNLSSDIVEHTCRVFEGACNHAKASRRRPITPTQQLFTPAEFEWFSKNAYNLSLKYCAEMQPGSLVRLLNACIEFIKLLKDHDGSDIEDLSLRSMFCDFLASCAFTTLARAEDNIQQCLQNYLQVRKHSQEFRQTAAQILRTKKVGESAQADIIAKHFQIVKLELEAALKLEKWDALDELFEECWKYEDPKHLETLADLVLVIHSCIVKADIEGKYQERVLKVLSKIINLTWRQTNNDVIKISRWIRCLFQLSLTFDEAISLKCLDQASQIAAARLGVSLSPCPSPLLQQISLPISPPASSSPVKVEIADEGSKESDKDHYPTTELEWLAATSFNHAVDYYLQENDAQCKVWAETALNVAQWVEDGGALKGLLMEKYSGLVWSE